MACPRDDKECAKLGRCRKWCQHVQTTNRVHRVNARRQLDAQGSEPEDEPDYSHYRAKHFRGIY